MRKTYKISLDEQGALVKSLESRSDAEAARIKRYLSMPDLTRTPGSPLYEMIEKIKAKAFPDFDLVEIPEIVPTDISFDLFDFPAEHPARSKSDTYYVDKTNILRTHDTVFWYYYLNHPEVKERIARGEALGAICYGKVYRKDEIDSRHLNVFHQFGAWYIAPDSKGVGFDELKEAVGKVVVAIFGERESRFNTDNFPYTDPSYEVEVNVKGTAAEGPAKGEWLEILGSGMPKKSVLKKLGGVEGYSGWAFGFGLERLAIASMDIPDIRLLWSNDERVKSQLKLGQRYKEVSKYPPVVRDISFVVGADFVLNDYFDAIRDILGDSAEQVELKDKYENVAKFGEGKTSYTFRITYRDLNKTLTNEEVNTMHAGVEEMTKKDFGGELRLS
jgi:phenylalanyl-tRNA synthetase alpha chain